MSFKCFKSHTEILFAHFLSNIWQKIRNMLTIYSNCCVHCVNIRYCIQSQLYVGHLHAIQKALPNIFNL